MPRHSSGKHDSSSRDMSGPQPPRGWFNLLRFNGLKQLLISFVACRPSSWPPPSLRYHRRSLRIFLLLLPNLLHNLRFSSTYYPI
ncbi:hypothetical protein SLA2020_367590 [Shorea laevis]